MFGACNASIGGIKRGLRWTVLWCAIIVCGAAAAENESWPGLADRIAPLPIDVTPIRLKPSRSLVKPDAVLGNTARLPTAVAETRERLLNAAKSGDLRAVKKLIEEGKVKLSFEAEPPEDPIKMWRKQYPESEGVEVLAALVGVMESDFIALDAGSDQEIYVWPYFAHVALKDLDPPRLVELYRLLTAFDVQRMREAGAYIFFRVGISANGTWQYFVSGAPEK